MGYIFLGLSLLSGTLKGYCGKLVGNTMNGFRDAALANSIRMSICAFVGLIIAICSGAGFILPFKTFLICLLSGVSLSGFVLSWLVLVKNGAYMMIDVFVMIGTVVPIIFGTILFGESIKALQVFGIGLILIAALIMCSYNNSIKQKLTIKSVLLLILCGAANGFSDLSQKLIVTLSPDTHISVFNLYTYVISTIVLFGFFAFLKKDKAEDSLPKIKKAFIHILIMAVSLFLVTYFKTLSAKYLDSAILYPVYQGSCLILSSLMCAIFFGEKLTAKCILGLTVAGLGMIILNFAK